MPRPGIFDWPAPPVTSAHDQERGDIGQQACGAGMASRTADGNHSGVARPSRHWATGDCTRFEKPVRLGLRQSSGAPRLPAFTASSHRHHRCFCLLLVAAIRRCNELRLLSRRIIIRLFDDVKKKVQKNLRARASRSTSLTHRDDSIIDTLVHLDFHTPSEVPPRGRCASIRWRRALRRTASRDTSPPSIAHCRRLPNAPSTRTAARRAIHRKAAWMLAFTAMACNAHGASPRHAGRARARRDGLARRRSGTRSARFTRIDARGFDVIASDMRRHRRASIRQLREYDERVMRQRNGLSPCAMR